ncbi:sugar kinase [Ferdinandcohnia quinoae]|uniref:Sugar kinase n=1 Tax=Fredinandcohnia quinoae TaxID=2918902 RepID=A0AAW5E2F0_9BACI|nr:sugar kinase [Fredinandcohnia sp. SECRCQ15]MCH1625445.1 sugar kinase [Fredinandcohnia sp. SECRCQ15]
MTKKIVTFGEMLLRFSTSQGERLSQAHHLTAHYGGAEANVAVSMSHFGYKSFLVSKVPNNPIGTAALKHLRSHGVYTDYIFVGGERLGTYYLEAGAGERSAHVTYDRKYSSFSQLEKDEINLDEILSGATLFHVSGITLALSPELRELTLLALKKAKERGVRTSLDFNYRAKLWSQQEASEVIQVLLPYIDICFFGELDAVHLLGLDHMDDSLPMEERLLRYYTIISKLYPDMKYISSTFRTVISASSNRLQGNLFTDGTLYQSKIHHIEPIIDRVGGGDAFAAGILSGILDELPPEQIVSFATAASALKHTIHGDCNAFSKDEVIQFANSESGKIVR